MFLSWPEDQYLKVHSRPIPVAKFGDANQCLGFSQRSNLFLGTPTWHLPNLPAREAEAMLLFLVYAWMTPPTDELNGSKMRILELPRMLLSSIQR
jgi:hypothetical protein